VQDSDRNLTYMLWTVVGVLLVGGAITSFMLMHHADDLSQANNVLVADNHNLARQLAVSKAQPSPTPSQSPSEP
jgi:hypothetical protein